MALFTGLFITAEKGLKKHCPAKCSQGSTHDNPSIQRSANYISDVNAFRNGQCEVFAVVPSASERFFDCYFQRFVIAVVCDTFVVNVNAAVDYRYVFVFINCHSYCVVNYFSNFYRYCVTACQVYSYCSCGACFSGSSFNFQTFDCPCVCCTIQASNIFQRDNDFIIVIPIFVQSYVINFCCRIINEFETAVQFQFQFVFGVATNFNEIFEIANCCFNFNVFQCCNFFCSNINCVFNGSFDTFCFDGSEYQVLRSSQHLRHEAPWQRSP